MGKPAARLTDTAMTCNDPADLPSGVVVAAGTVMINNLPAAKKGDQIVGVDIHIIMIPTPGGPVPTPLPHPFVGIIDNAVSTSVKIMGQPAAMQNSMASNTPAHIPQGGPFQKPPTNKGKIMMGSPNVMIGNGGGGGGGAGGSGGLQKAKAKAAQAKDDEGHFLDVTFVDKGGKPIMGAGYTVKTPDDQQIDGTLVGQVKRKGLSEGNCEIRLRAIVDARWSDAGANVGDKVKLVVKTAGMEDGEKVTLQIFVKDANFADRQYETIEAEIQGDKVEHEWELKIDDKLLEHQDDKDGQGRYSVPYFYFVALVGGLKQKSGLLKYQDWVELRIEDNEGQPLKNKKYRLHFPNGEVREGTLDSQGHAKEEDVPAGRARVAVDPRK